MPYMIAKSAGRCGILIILLAMPTGCANSKRSAARMTLPNGRVVKPGEVGNELQEDLSQFMDYAENQIGTTADQIEAGTQDDEVRKAALRWKVELMQTSAKRPPQNKSMAFLMDAWTFCIRTTNYFQSGEGKNLFRDQQPLAIQAAARVQKAVETVARKHIAADQLPDVIRSLESYARANPMHGIFVHEVPESFSAGHEGKSVLSHVLDVPLELIRSGRRALDPTSSGAQALDRFTELMADYPALVRWQAQLLWLELENSTSFRTTMSGIETFSQNSERLIATAEALPQQLREELRLALDDIDGRQPELRKTLEKVRETVDAANAALARAETVSATVERSIEGVTRVAEAVTDTIKQFQQSGTSRPADESTANNAADPASGGAGGTNTKKGSFDITAYTQTAEALTRSTAELRDLLSEVRSFLAGETLEKDLARVVPLTKAALAQTVTETRGIVDYIAWRAVQLCGLVFLLALIYRFLVGRFVVGRAMSQ
ncbi:MAG: hypothetical protein IIC02_05450 [Planctomycetes bacterium]|nr:hypothetical protein [Planctomycetota bacterium]